MHKMNHSYVEYKITIILIVLFIILYLSFNILHKELFFQLVASSYAILKGGEYYRLMTNFFMHKDLLHLCGNFAGLYVVGIIY